jgi:hypothetical protein
MLRRVPFFWLLVILIGAEACSDGEESRHAACEGSAAECAVESWGPVEPALAARFQSALEAARAEQGAGLPSPSVL